ncbi:MAG: hypothetical protein WBZ07_00005, partial [Candidatus Dormiibacterota bacterium]
VAGSVGLASVLLPRRQPAQPAVQPVPVLPVPHSPNPRPSWVISQSESGSELVVLASAEERDRESVAVA